MESLIRTIKRNKFFIISLLVLATVFFSTKAEVLVLRGLMRTGLYTPDVSHLSPKAANIKPLESPLNAAPPLIFKNSKEETLKLSDFRGKVVFINFWATWCPPCIAEMPSINKLKERVKVEKDIVFILVDIDGNLSTSTSFMNKNGFDLPVYSVESAIPKSIFTGSIPTSLIVDKKGNIVFHEKKMADYNTPEIEAFLTDLAKL